MCLQYPQASEAGILQALESIDLCRIGGLRSKDCQDVLAAQSGRIAITLGLTPDAESLIEL